MRAAMRMSGLIGLFSVGLVLLGCRKEKEAPPQMPAPSVGVIKPAVAPVQAFYDYNGHLETTQMVEVRARVKGLITKIHFKDGTEVRGQRGAGFLTVPGDLLYSIDDREYRTAVKKAEAELEKADADIGNWKAQIQLAKAELKRAERAADVSASAQADVDKARATVGVNDAMLAQVIANRDAAAAALHTAHIQLGYTQIHARIDGRISRTHVDEGNLVGQTEPTMLTTIVRMDELFVYFDVPENDWAKWGNRLANNLNQTIPLEVGTVGEEGHPHKGRIDFRENRVDVNTGTVRIRGRVPNPVDPATGTRRLYPGLYARIRVPAGEAKPSPVIPEEALMTGQEGRYVYVVGPDNKVMKKSIELGPQVYRAAPAIANKSPEW
ncbi:MAG: efflux RND transporter periplasmic adaptor subunit, partial [Burkholderia sp.]|nr:efflux RND transporter periplasmic adaptor subunit [Burkholderia sp.]